MRLKDYLREDFIVARLSARDMEGVLKEVSAKAGSADVGAADLIAEKLLEREHLHPTVIGAGLAIPHATVEGLSAPVIGIALAGEPIQFGPPEDEPVEVFFVLLSPPGSEREHVKLLARICRLARHEDFIDRLEEASDEAGILDVVEAIDAQHI